jgi:acetate CoA/acetoacetate CoA-transferase alpha subunit
MQSISLEQSVAMIPDSASLMIGGFMAVGTPERVISLTRSYARRSAILP